MSSSVIPFVFTQLQPLHSHVNPQFLLELTADERTKSRHYFEAKVLDDTSQATGLQGVYLRLPRGTVLNHDDCLGTNEHDVTLRIVAKPEPVMVVTSADPLMLLKAAYHLGNRHVALEVSLNSLRFAPDPVLKQLVNRMGLALTENVLPFQPEAGAYSRSSHHRHSSPAASDAHSSHSH